MEGKHLTHCTITLTHISFTFKCVVKFRLDSFPSHICMLIIIFLVFLPVMLLVHMVLLYQNSHKHHGNYSHSNCSLLLSFGRFKVYEQVRCYITMYKYAFENLKYLYIVLSSPVDIGLRTTFWLIYYCRKQYLNWEKKIQ